LNSAGAGGNYWPAPSQRGAKATMKLLTALALIMFAGPATGARTARTPTVTPASLEAVWKEIKRPGAEVVVVNIWATWCEPCKDEMPDILRAHREHKDRGVRLLLISADPVTARPSVARYLGALGVDFPSFLKVGDDMQFIDGLSPKWDGTLPATLLFDGQGKALHTWSGSVTYATLKQKLEQILPPTKRRNP
jgi:thiol-disulfide isomerase/thioredoxin